MKVAVSTHEKVHILTQVPRSWSICKDQSEFNVNQGSFHSDQRNIYSELRQLFYI